MVGFEVRVWSGQPVDNGRERERGGGGACRIKVLFYVCGRDVVPLNFVCGWYVQVSLLAAENCSRRKRKVEMLRVWGGEMKSVAKRKLKLSKYHIPSPTGAHNHLLLGVLMVF